MHTLQAGRIKIHELGPGICYERRFANIVCTQNHTTFLYVSRTSRYTRCVQCCNLACSPTNRCTSFAPQPDPRPISNFSIRFHLNAIDWVQFQINYAVVHSDHSTFRSPRRHVHFPRQPIPLRINLHLTPQSPPLLHYTSTILVSHQQSTPSRLILPSIVPRFSTNPLTRQYLGLTNYAPRNAISAPPHPGPEMHLCRLSAMTLGPLKTLHALQEERRTYVRYNAGAILPPDMHGATRLDSEVSDVSRT